MNICLLARLPTRQETFQIFAVIIFTVHVWSILNFLYIVSALIARLTSAEFLGVLSYVLVFALFESIVVLAVLLLLAFVLPRRWLRKKIVARGSLIVIISAIWMIPVHYSESIIPLFFNSAFKRGIFWFLVFGVYAFTVWDLALILDRHPKVLRSFLAFVDRLGVVSWMYLLADFAGLLVIIYRLFG